MNTRQAVILTALPIEYQAVRAHLKDIKETTHPQGTVYETGIFACPDGEPWAVTIAEIGAGNSGAALETERAARFFKPSILLFVGVAGGIKDVELCDVVIATKVYGYESGKSKDTFEPRPSVGESSYSLVQRARAEARKNEWMKRLRLFESDSVLRPPHVYVAPIAAGEKIVASRRSDVFRFLREQYGDAVAVEMEGRGFLQAAHANPHISALIVRGISDLLAGKSLTDRAGYQERAAEHASAFAFEILARLEASKEAGEYVLVLTATIAEVDRPRAEAIVAHLRELTGDARLTLKRLEEGSVRLVLEGSRDGFDLLKAMADSGRLSAALGLTVADLLWMSESSGSKERSDLEEAVATFLPEAKAGSREAINGLFEAAYPFLRRMAQLDLRRLYPSTTWTDAEDLLIDALIKAYRSLASFQGTTAQEFLRWIRVLTTRLALDSMRRHKDTDEILDPSLGVVEGIEQVELMQKVERALASLHESPDVIKSIEQSELMQTVQRAMASLHEQDRVLIEMFYLEETPLNDIAKALNLSPGFVRVKLLRAMRRLQELSQ